jgi:Ni,Fe-hydrogenase I cytochrome b subunit
MTPKVPIDTSIDFIHGYLQQEHPEVQIQIIANVLFRFMWQYVDAKDHRGLLEDIAAQLPYVRAMNMPTVGGVQ